jgi:hypothetical protein
MEESLLSAYTAFSGENQHLLNNDYLIFGVFNDMVQSAETGVMIS